MKKLEDLYYNYYGIKPVSIIPLKSDGSDRQIFRIFEQSSDTKIGIIGNNREENEAFINYSRHFKNFRLNVPEIYTLDLDQGVYIEEDLGDDTLFIWMMNIRAQHGFTDEIKTMYEKVIRELPEFQIRAGRSIDYSFAYQHIEFSRESMSWDLHYFKSRFLNYFYKSRIDHTRLESDFNILIDYLLEENREFFLYRDFQSRNIMIKDGTPYFIDYQSGRKGALQYDLASLLYDAKADLNEKFREEMIDVYIVKTREMVDLNVDRFREYFWGFVLIRIMQAFGAYGYLSAIKGKTHFFKSVPYAIANLEIICNKNIPILEKCSNLKTIFLHLIQDQSLREFTADE